MYIPEIQDVTFLNKTLNTTGTEKCKNTNIITLTLIIDKLGEEN